ncbi:MAG: Internalin-like protein (LPXTG motif) Lmo0331 homolog [uncultured Aureispira sp.]|uniref:Internalin-like protein (LPXTG motif) Lmo0331 homolog n=1 Tax=uncultured Aureispira sp. TaxID=1331704 RepID=A0A6S6UJU5_9BACT|nr:MAG: Internalin-like protein (LPXTG motif) Lmo0331 homolog [uncultured Aureispira sp.]
MNRITTLLILGLTLCLGTTTLQAQNVNIPDANFKAYLLGDSTINTNENSEIEFSEASAFSGKIDCHSMSIADLTGVEAFVNLTQLVCYDNNLSSLDVSQNRDLVWLHCAKNSISSLSVIHNTSLTKLYCSSNPLFSLNLSQNTHLERLYANLTRLSSLDVARNTNLVVLDCSSAELNSLNVRNGNNTAITTFKVRNNPNLTCIEVDDANYSTVNWASIDPMASFNTNCNLSTQNVRIPDANFKAYLLGNTAINTNGDTQIQLSEALAFTGRISCSSRNIRDLTGIEAFVNLTQLDCSSNDLTSLDVSQNTSLTVLDCSSAQLSSLNVKNGNNTNFTFFDARSNTPLGCIEVDNVNYSTANWRNIGTGSFFSANCSALTVHIPDANFKACLVGNTAINTNGDTEIQVSEAMDYTGIISCINMNISDLTGIEFFVNAIQLICYKNNLTSLDVSQNTKLVVLHCAKNSITNLDVSQNTKLVRLYCSNNLLTTLDLTQNRSLQRLYCNTNQLTTLDVRNGNNTGLSVFYAQDNSSLACIAVDNVPYSTANWTNIDPVASFRNTTCAGIASVVNIPDANFKAYLVGHTAINTNGDAEIQFSEASAFNGTVNCANRTIADLTGIEAFVNITRLYCDTNNLTTIDVSQNTSLIELRCSMNQLTSLNVTQNTNLIQLRCKLNQLTSLNVAQNTALTYLDCAYNQLSALNVTQNTSLVTLFCTSNSLTNLNVTQNASLTYLYCASNQLTSLNVTQNTNMTQLVCSSNQLTTLDVTQNTAFTHFYCSMNQLTSLDVTQNTNLRLFRCNDNNLSSLDVRQNTALTTLWCYSNQISSLNVSQNTALTVLWCYSNLLTSLNLTQNTSLEILTCSFNQLSNLDVSQNTSLTTLNCASNLLTSFDLSQNTSLTTVRCGTNQLSSLNVKNGNNTSITTFYANNNSNLTCIEVDNAAYSTANWTNIDAGASFSNSCTSTSPSVVYIPDANFKAILLADIAINLNGDTEIQVTEAVGYTGSVYCSYSSIADYTGLEAFVNLTGFTCDGNPSGSLDVSQNTNLEWLHCDGNNLTSLDVTQNTNLTELRCPYNNLTSIDLTQNVNLVTFSIDDNQLTSLDVSQNTNLEWLYCYGNNLTSLDVTQNTNLTELWCFNNQLTSLDLTQNLGLKFLYCTTNQLTSLDVSQNILLEWLYCNENQITSLDVSQNVNLTDMYCSTNQLSSLNVKNGNNINLLSFDALSNPNLTCIEVDDSLYAVYSWATYIDSTAYFSNDCSVARLAQRPNAINGSLTEKAAVLNNTGISNNAMNLSAYPNPTTKEITLDFGKTYTATTIQVSNLTGQIVLSKQLENRATTSLALEGAAGVYFIHIQTEEGSTILKVIKE